MDIRFVVVVVSVAAVIVCVTMLLLTNYNRYYSQIRRRITRASDFVRGERSTLAQLPATPTIGKQGDGPQSVFAGYLSTGESELVQFRERLIRAGITSPNGPAVFLAARVFAMSVPAVIGIVLVWSGATTVRQGLIGGAAAATLGYLLPNLWLDRRIAKRSTLLRRGLPDFLDLMIVCLKSGLSLAGALQRVGEEIRIAHPLLADELTVMQREMTLGSGVDRAFRNFADRTGLEVVRTLSTFIRESQRFGSELVEAFRAQAEALRYEREQRAEEQAQRASVKILFPMLLLILPAVFIVLAGPAAIQIQEAFSK